MFYQATAQQVDAVVDPFTVFEAAHDAGAAGPRLVWRAGRKPGDQRITRGGLAGADVSRLDELPQLLNVLER